MSKVFVGRTEEKSILNDLLKINSSEFIAVVGRRRIGKTYLIKTIYEKHMSFHYTGINQASKAEQLQAFHLKLKTYLPKNKRLTPPSNWIDALGMLQTYLSSKKSKKKKVIFLDELPWIASAKSGFMKALEYFWNDWAVDQNLILVVCGSASNWMIKHLRNNRAGLHNRITKYIHLSPFTLKETEEFFIAKNINLSKYEIVQIYMVMGGVPHYLKEIKRGKSSAQNIDQICFSPQGLLRNEFENLYRALFDNHEKYEEIIKLLSKKRKGLTRKEIIANSKLTNGGALTKMLNDLKECSFIAHNLPYRKRERDTIYRLIDEFSNFYFQFIYQTKSMNKGSWIMLSQKAMYKAWSGYTFEGVCLKHIESIKHALGIAAVYTEQSSFIQKGNKTNEGVQIDLVLDRADNIIHLFEIKFHKTAYTLTKNEAEKIEKRKRIFRSKTKNREHIFTTLLTCFPPAQSRHLYGIDQVLLLEDLFHL